MPKASLI